MTDSRTLGQRVPKEGLFLMDGIEGLRSLPKHSVDSLLHSGHLPEEVQLLSSGLPARRDPRPHH